MKAFVAITDWDWSDLLSGIPNLEEVDFWQPSGSRLFRALEPGELFLFKLHSPRNFIAGGGLFAHSTLLPIRLAWETFGIAAGASSGHSAAPPASLERPGPPAAPSGGFGTRGESSGGADHRLLLGVTGGIASGKTAVTRMLEALGSPVIDFDVLARVVVEPGKPAYEDIVSFFGKEILQADRIIDRKKLSRIVFQDPEKRKKLEGFTHSRIAMEYLRQADALAAKHPDAIIQVAVPLLIEANLQHLFHKILVVYVPRQVQIERLMLRDGITRQEAESILAAQMPIDEKLAKADFVINNEGTLEETRAKVEALWQSLRDLQALRKPAK